MSFPENSIDSVFDGFKVTSQFDAHVYICERSGADWIWFSTII